MKIRKSILTASTGILLAAFSGMALASSNPQKPSSSTATKQALPKADSKSATSVSRGTITSIDKDRLVLAHKAKNAKAEELTFMLNSKTERKGDLTPGSRVSVHYRAENNQLMATAIQAMPQKTAKKPVVKK
jgi:Domain of unknown function (DUF5666)